MNFKKIKGARIYLSPMSVDDAELFTAWLNDIEVSQYIGAHSSVDGLISEKEYIEKEAQKGYNFSIVLNDNDQTIGTISLMDINQLHRRATLGMFIGDRAYHNRGYGAEAINLILDYGFKWLNLHNVMVSVFANNPRAIACYKKVGFREFGRRTDYAFLNGEWVAGIQMEILDTDFRAKKEG